MTSSSLFAPRLVISYGLLKEFSKTSSRQLQDIFNTSSRTLQHYSKTLWRGRINTDIHGKFRTSSRLATNYFKNQSRQLRQLEDSFKYTQKQIIDYTKTTQRLLKDFFKRTQRLLQDYIKNSSRPFQDLFRSLFKDNLKISSMVR